MIGKGSLRVLLSVVLGVMVTVAVGCASVDRQMKDDVGGGRCVKAGHKGQKWLANELPRQLESARGKPVAMRALAKRHLGVAEQMLKALACIAADRNTIAALRAYRMAADTLTKSMPKSLQGRLANERKQLDAMTLDREATLHYFQVAVPSGRIETFAEHRTRYPSSRYVKAALRQELELASLAAKSHPAYEEVARFAGTYKDVPQAAAELADLWRASARWELQKNLKSGDLDGIVRYLERFATVADQAQLNRAMTMLQAAVQTRVTQLQTARSSADMLRFLTTLTTVRLPKGSDGVRRWLDLRVAVIQRELTVVAYEETVRDGTRKAYARYVATWTNDPTAAERIRELKTALAISDQWQAMGADPLTVDLVHFIAERGELLSTPAVKGLQGMPRADAAVTLATRKAADDECAANFLLMTCKTARWCRPHKAALVQLGKDYRKLKRIRKRQRLPAPACGR